MVELSTQISYIKNNPEVFWVVRCVVLCCAIIWQSLTRITGLEVGFVGTNKQWLWVNRLTNLFSDISFKTFDFRFLIYLITIAIIRSQLKSERGIFFPTRVWTLVHWNQKSVCYQWAMLTNELRCLLGLS